MGDMGLGGAILDIEACSYGYSRLLFRGPPADLDGPFLGFIGATETVGPFLTRPFPSLVAQACGFECVNLGIKNAGPDVFLRDRAISELASQATAIVLEALSVTNQTTPLYRVHPRRNDRVICALPALYDLVPGLDMAEVHFTGHLMAEIGRLKPDALAPVLSILQRSWVERMRRLVSLLRVPVHVFAFSRASHVFAAADAFMLAELEDVAVSVTRFEPSRGALAEGTASMFFAPSEAPAALALHSAHAHREAAACLAEKIGHKDKTARTG
ncbi:MAG: DUF6473 family protein [Pseudomonadota bacterium]